MSGKRRNVKPRNGSKPVGPRELIAALDVESQALSSTHVLVAHQLKRLKVEALLLQRMLDSVEGREPDDPDTGDAQAAAAPDTAARVSTAPRRSTPAEGANAAAEHAACGNDGGRAASVHDDVFARAAEGLMAGWSDSEGDGEGDSSADDAGGSDAEDDAGEAQPAPAAKRRRVAARAKRGGRSAAHSQAGDENGSQADGAGNGARSKRGAKVGGSGVAVVKRGGGTKPAAAVATSQDAEKAAVPPADGSKAQQRPSVVRRAARGRGGGRRGGRGAGGRDDSSGASAAPRRGRSKAA